MTPAYEDVVDDLERRGMMPDRPPGIQTTREGLRRLGLNINPERAIVVAGTNGKGSTCAMLEALLRSAGCRTGLYTSPHLVDTTERIRVDAQDTSRHQFVAAYRAVLEKTKDLALSHFEMLTLMAAWQFSAEAVDWMIFEVGLGGLWDATNAIPHRFCVVTKLGLDHQNLLGDTIADIAKAKFGIVGPGATVIHTAFEKTVDLLARQTAQETASRWVEAAEFETGYECGTREPQFFAKTKWGVSKLSLPGDRASENAALALTIFSELGYDPALHLAALSKARWRGRMERLNVSDATCPIYVSGDHNPQGIQSLLGLLAAYKRKHLHLLVGLGRDKDLDGVLGPLFSLANTSVYLTETPFKGRTLAEFGPYLNRVAGAWPDQDTALEQVLQRAQPEEMVVVTGSLYLVGHYLKPR